MKFRLLESDNQKPTEEKLMNEKDNLFTSASSYFGQRNSYTSNRKGNGKDYEISKYTDVNHIDGNHSAKPTPNNCIVTTKKMHKAIHNETIRRLIDWVKRAPNVGENVTDETLTKLFTLLSLDDRDSTINSKRKSIDNGVEMLDKFRDVIDILKGAKGQYETTTELVTHELMNDPRYNGEWRPYR